jgi:hypothetical protein
MSLKSEPIRTVLTITVGFIALYLITKWQWALYLSIIFGVIGLLSNTIAKSINYIWFKMTWIFSLIVPNLLLTLVFFFILIPLAYLSKAFKGHNQLKLKNTDRSMFIEKRRDFSNDFFNKMW